MHHHLFSYGTHTYRREIAHGAKPCRVLARTRASPADSCTNRKRRGVGTPTTSVVSAGAGKHSALGRAPALLLALARDSVMRVRIPRARATVASRSPTPTAGGSTPSERALGRIASPATSTLTTAEASSSGPAPPGPEMGRTRHGAQLPVQQSSIRHRGFDSLPTHHARQAEQERHPALTREELGSRPRARTVPP